jgi:hypothetical protein
MTPTDPTPDLATLHEDDSYGDCVICREWVPHTDDEYRGVAFPCPTVRLARAEAAVPDDPFMVDDNDALPNACYRCWGRWPKHHPDCAWLAARPAR